MFCRCDWLQVITGDTRGKRKYLGTDHNFLQFPSQWPNHCRSTGENDKLSADNFGFKGCSDCAKKGCSNPSTTRGSSRGVAFSLFYICVRIYSLSRLILTSRWLTTVEQKTQSLTPGSSKIHLLVSLISRNTHLTPRWIDTTLVSKLKSQQSFKKIVSEQQIFCRFARSKWTHQKM